MFKMCYPCNTAAPQRTYRPFDISDPKHRFRLFPVRSPLLGESILFIFLWVLRCFTSPGTLPTYVGSCNITCTGFPHSVIPGSKPARRLPEAYRSHATTFIAFCCQGILHTPLLPYKITTHKRW